MQFKLSSKIAISFLLLAVTTNLPAVNAAGRTNQSIPNSILNGKGAPTSKIGINGDFYIDVLSFNMYGPKTKNRWPAPVALRGPAGSAGKDGEKGSSSSGADGSRGPKGDSGSQGIQGLKGDKGEKGEKGEKGDPGEKGATGAQGITGATGLQGIKGDKGDTGATGLQGLKGDTGLTGLKGDQGLAGAKGDTGITGSKGDTGAKGDNGLPGSKGDTGSTGSTGATGPSNAYVGSIIFANSLQGSAGTSQRSNDFANLQAGKSYVFDVLIYGHSATDNLFLNLTASAMGDSPLVTTHWIPAKANTYRDSLARIEHAFFGRVSVDGSRTATDYQLSITVASGGNILAANAVTLSGGYSGFLVGSVSG